MVQHFFSSSSLLPNINNTLITLVSKAKHTQNFDEFRSISYYNFLYKIILKILANRFKAWLSHIITENQSVFVARINIQDNIVLNHEVMHALKNKYKVKKGYFSLKLDFAKA